MSTLSEDFQIQVTAEGKSGALKLTEVDSWGHQQLELTPDVNDGSKFRLKGGVLTTGDNSLVGRRIVEDRSLLPKIMVAGPQNSVQEIEYHVRPDMTLETVRRKEYSHQWIARGELTYHVQRISRSWTTSCSQNSLMEVGVAMTLLPRAIDLNLNRRTNHPPGRWWWKPHNGWLLIDIDCAYCTKVTWTAMSKRC
jgi:hypothetical protein